MRTRKNEKFINFMKTCSPEIAFFAINFPEIMEIEPLSKSKKNQLTEKIIGSYSGPGVCPCCGELFLAPHFHYNNRNNLLSELLDYSYDIVSGKLKACKKHRWACERFFRDMELSCAGKSEFRFHENRALHFINFMRLFKHRKGVLRGQYIEPDIIQKFIFGNVYGWILEKKGNDLGYRRFNKMYWQVARKNAKSQSLSLVGLYETLVFNRGIETMEVYCAATKSDQARIVFNEALGMLDRCEAIKSLYTFKYGRICHNKTASTMRVLSEEDRKLGDGLNPQCAIVDEYQAHPSAELYDILDSGMVARPEALMAIITTAGFDFDNPCYRVEYDQCTKILDPDHPLEMNNYFVMINELDKNETSETINVDGRKIGPGELIDNIKDESIWPKANPIVCTYDVGVQNIRRKQEEALNVPEKMRNFLTKIMNIWVNRRDFGYMDLSKWSACAALSQDNFPDLTGLSCISGVDLSSTIDLTSVAFVCMLPSGHYAVQQHSFTPREMYEKMCRIGKIPYEFWAKQGFLSVTDGAEVDYHFVLEYIENQYEKNNWDRGQLCFDKNLATWLMAESEKRNFLPIEIPQSFTGLSVAIKVFRAKVYNQKIIHNNDPLLTWAIGNAITKANPSEQLLLDKSRSRGRIDPLIAVINAMVRATANELIEEPVYNSRGLRSLS